MTIELLHQCGYHSSWNLTSFSEHQCGDGLILSPVHQDRGSVEKLSKDIRENSFFDPQFYLPNSQKVKLSTYDFFPETITGGFSTLDFSLVAKKAAYECLAFQREMGFRGVLIPSRYLDQMYTDFIDRQKGYTVEPFLEVIDASNVKGPVYLTLTLTGHMVTDKVYRTQILNWVTSYPRIDGLYLIACVEKKGKQIADPSVLKELMLLVQEMKLIGLDVIVGYLNTEAVLLTLIDGITVTMGSFENTRSFSIDKFLQTDEERRGPKARIYLPKLLTWIQVNQAKEIRAENAGLWKEIYTETPEAEAALSQAKEPTFNQPSLYYHHFKCMAMQIAELSTLSVKDRYERLKADIRHAMKLHEEIQRKDFSLEKYGRGDHLQAWLDAINGFWRGSPSGN